MHKGKRFVFNIDIEDYFNQFNFGRVRGFFINDRDFLLHPIVATTIAQIACFENGLPQGSPVSPHLANLLTKFFDVRMTRFLRPRKCTYSRYADDITISTNMSEFPPDVAIEVAGDPHGWAVAPALADIFARSGLPLNPSKTRMSHHMGRQMVTGLVVNKNPNVTREYYLTTRAMCHRLFNAKTVNVPDITENFGDNCAELNVDVVKTKSVMNIIEGRLSHIHHIREKNDLRKIQEKQDNPTQFWSMLQDYFIFKYFYANVRPIILTEGPSDVFYIKAAIQSYQGSLGNLKTPGSKPKILPWFFSFNTTAANVLGLNGGAGNIKRFLYLYHARQVKFKAVARGGHVIIVIDNDSGGKDVINMVNGIYKTNIHLNDPKMIHKITSDLILVKTPHIKGKMQTSIEDMLPAKIRSINLGGKTFSAEKKFDNSKHFGKIILSKYVRENSSPSNFKGFEEFIRSIDSAVVI